MQKLDKASIKEKIDSSAISDLNYEQLHQCFHDELGQSTFLPDGLLQIDPRTNDRVIYSSARSKRPHDNKIEVEKQNETELLSRPCVICEGKITGIVDLAELSEGFSFINKNLYPVLFPKIIEIDDPEKIAAGKTVYGMHFLQWTSSIHDRDWHNMPLSDCVIALERLAALEKQLIELNDPHMPNNQTLFNDPKGRRGFVAIIKNYGSLVGGSLIHGHQQIAFCNTMPRRLRDNWIFKQTQNENYSDYMLRENPEDLTIKKYPGAKLIVPYFMRRPFDMQLLVENTQKAYLFELSAKEIQSVSQALSDGIRLIRTAMQKLGRELAYNIIVHNGPGAGLYLEFLPYTQEFGGYEHLGLILCQSTPQIVVKQAKEWIV